MRSLSKDGFPKAVHDKNFSPLISGKDRIHRASYDHMSDHVAVKNTSVMMIAP